MKRFGLQIVTWLFLLIVSGCDKQEAFVRSYPQLASTELKSVTTAGVRIEATMDHQFMSRVIDHGFVWTEHPDPRLTPDGTSFSMGVPTTATFTADINARIRPNKTYYIRPYLKTADHTVYGHIVSFESKGSAGPGIESFSPKIVVPKDLVTIKGQNFGTVKDKTFVRFIADNRSYPAVIKSITNSEIIVEVPEFWEETATITVQFPGDDFSSAPENIRRKLPRLLNVKPGGLCDPVEFVGENLLMLGQAKWLTVNFQDLTSLATITDTSIKFPYTYHAASFIVQLAFDEFTLNTNLANTYIKPVITSAPPEIVHPLDIITLTGTNLPTCPGFSVTTNDPNTKLSLVEQTSTQIKLKVDELGCNPFSIVMTSSYVLVWHSPTIDVPPLHLELLTPDHGQVGSQIVLTGTNLAGGNVVFGNAFTFPNTYGGVNLPAQPDGQDLIATIPSDLNFGALIFVHDDVVNVTVEKCGVYTNRQYTLEFVEPQITDFNPKAIASTQTFTITGNNFLEDPRLDVILSHTSGEYLQKIISRTNTQLVVEIDWLTQVTGTLEVDVIVMAYARRYPAAGKLSVTFP